MSDHQMGAAFEFLLPCTGLGNVRLNNTKLGVQLLQDGCVFRVLINSHKLTQILALQARKQVLADEARSPSDYNFSR
jgi:hypothetical protein